MNKEVKNFKQQRIIYAVFAIVVLIGIFFFAGEYLDTKKENQLLKQAIINEKEISSIRLRSINEMREIIKQEWDTEYICRNQTSKKLYACGVEDE